MLNYITDKQIVDLAIQSIRKVGNLTLFWGFIGDLRARGLRTTDDRIRLVLVRNDGIIREVGRRQGTLDRNPPPGLSYETASWGSREVVLPNLADVKPMPISLLERYIPNYMDLIRPKPRKVFLVDKTSRTREHGGVLSEQPLFKVVAEYSRKVHTGGLKPENRLLFILGKDAFTGHPFALSIPSGFIRLPWEACMRWTMDLHGGEDVIEV